MRRHDRKECCWCWALWSLSLARESSLAPGSWGARYSLPPCAPGRSRDNPAETVFLSRRRLNKPGSHKETWHIEFDLRRTGLDYAVGDSFGIYPANDPALVDAIIATIGAPPDFPIGGRTLREVLTDGVSLGPAPDMLFQLLSYLIGGERRQKAKMLADGEDPDGDAQTLDVLAAMQKFSGVRPDPEAFIEALDTREIHGYRAELGFRVFADEALVQSVSDVAAAKAPAGIAEAKAA